MGMVILASGWSLTVIVIVVSTWVMVRARRTGSSDPRRSYLAQVDEFDTWYAGRLPLAVGLVCGIATAALSGGSWLLALFVPFACTMATGNGAGALLRGRGNPYILAICSTMFVAAMTVGSVLASK